MPRPINAVNAIASVFELTREIDCVIVVILMFSYAATPDSNCYGSARLVS
jgi:hypothetical protein